VLTIQALGVNASMIEEASTRALADHFGISAELITAVAQETRRLDATPRRLPGTWNILYEFHASPSQTEQLEVAADAVMSDPAAFFSDFTQLLHNHLIEAGVDESVVNSIVVVGATATVTVPGTDSGEEWVGMATPNIGATWLTLLWLLFSLLLI